MLPALNRPWDNQPQIAARLNPAYYSSKYAVYNPAAGLTIGNFNGGATAFQTVSGTGRITAGYDGLGATSSDTSAPVRSSVNLPTWANGTPKSILIYLRTAALGGSYIYVLGAGAFSMFALHTSTANRWGAYDGASLRSSGQILAANTTYCLLTCIDAAGTVKFFCNGLARATESTSAAVGGAPLYIGSYTDGTLGQASTIVHLAAIVDMDLSPFAARLGTNPWNLFEPQSKYIPAYTAKGNLIGTTEKPLRPVMLERVIEFVEQPQGADEIDWSNPITQGLGLLTVGESSRNIGASGNVDSYNVINSVGASTQSGVARAYNGSAFDYCSTNFNSRPHPYLGDGTPYSLLAVVVCDALPSALISIVGTTYYPTTPDALVCSIGISAANNWIFTQRATAVTATTIGPPVVVGRLVTIIGTSDGRLYIDGQLVAQTTHNYIAPVSNWQFIVKGGFTDAAFFTGRIALEGGWKRGLSDAEAKSVSANPWQLFAKEPSITRKPFPQPRPFIKTTRKSAVVRTEQPQGAVGADLSSALGQGLIRCFAGSHRGYDSARAQLEAMAGGMQVAPYGGELCFAADGTDDYLPLSSVAELNAIGSGRPVSLLFRFASTLDSVRTLFSMNDGTTSNNFNVYIGDGATGVLTNELVTIAHNVGGVTTFIIGYTTATRSELFDGAMHTVQVSSNGAAWKIAIDGVDKTVTVGSGSNTGAFGGVSATVAAFMGRQFATLLPFSGSMSLAAIWDRGMSGFAAETHRNPWQLFTLGSRQHPNTPVTTDSGIILPPRLSMGSVVNTHPRVRIEY